MVVSVFHEVSAQNLFAILLFDKYRNLGGNRPVGGLITTGSVSLYTGSLYMFVVSDLLANRVIQFVSIKRCSGNRDLIPIRVPNY